MRRNDPDTPSTHGFAAYRRVLAAPHVPPLALASTVARMPSGMGAVTLVLYVHGITGSFAAAGLVAGAFTLAAGATGPLLARLIDRRGSRLVLTPGGLAMAAALAAVVVLGHAGAAPAALAAAAALAGAAMPPVGGVMRQRLPALIDAHDLPTVYALDSILIEVVFTLGPLLAGVLAATVGAGAAVIAAAVLGGAGSAWFAAIANVAPGHEHRHSGGGWAGAFASPRVRYLVLTGIPCGATFGALDVALPAFGATHGSSALGGPFTAALALGSAIGGIAYGARPHFLGSPTRAFLRLGHLQALTCLPILLAATVPEMFLAAALAGVCVAPLITVRNQLGQTDRLASTEAFTWLTLSLTLGAAASSILAGALVEAGGWRAGAGAAFFIPALASAIAYIGRGALPADGPGEIAPQGG